MHMSGHTMQYAQPYIQPLMGASPMTQCFLAVFPFPWLCVLLPISSQVAFSCLVGSCCALHPRKLRRCFCHVSFCPCPAFMPLPHSSSPFRRCSLSLFHCLESWATMRGFPVVLLPASPCPMFPLPKCPFRNRGFSHALLPVLCQLLPQAVWFVRASQMVQRLSHELRVYICFDLKLVLLDLHLNSWITSN